MPKRRSSSDRPVVVKFITPGTGKSHSITVYGSDLHQVAGYVERRLGERWKTTSLTDRRHRRRF